MGDFRYCFWLRFGKICGEPIRWLIRLMPSAWGDGFRDQFDGEWK